MENRTLVSHESQRKPDPGFYLLACERNGIKPSEAIFLDDIILQVLHLVDIELTSLHKVIRNLKSAKELGMKTIRKATFSKT